MGRAKIATITVTELAKDKSNALGSPEQIAPPPPSATEAAPPPPEQSAPSPMSEPTETEPQAASLNPNEINVDDLIAKAELKQHAFGTVWKRFDSETFADLVENICARGLDKDITMYQGKVLEGWHRYLACLAAEVQPKFTEFTGTDLEAAELVHASGVRRHSNADQRYAAFDLLCQVCRAFSDKYQGLKAKGEQQQKQGKPLGTGDQRVDVVEAKAKAAGVSKTTAKKVERVKKKNPGAVADIAAGKTTANKELAKIKKAETKGGKTAAKQAFVKGERPKIDEVIQILYRGLAKADEVQNLSPKAKAIEFTVNGYRIKAICQIM